MSRKNNAPDPPLSGDLRLASKQIYEEIPIDFPGRDALRESFLIQLPNDFANRLRSLLTVVFRDYQEAGMIETRCYEGSFIKGELLAASRDLRHLARFLALAAHNMIDQATDAEFVAMADQLAVQLYTTAESIDSRVLRPRRRKSTPADPVDVPSSSEET